VSALPALDGRPHRGGRSWIPLGLAAALAVAGAIALIDPGRVPPVPRPGSALARLLFGVGAAALTLLAWRAGRTHLLTRRVADLLVMVGLVWLIVAQYGLLHFGMTDLQWWVAHGLEVAGIGLIGIPAALDLRYAVASRPPVGDLRAVDLVADEEALLGGRVRALMLRLAAKDPSTEDHARRVAVLAVQIGERLWLADRWLRLLAVGGLLHDIGKLAVPTHILTKPGGLTEEEYSLVRRHPGWGRELLAELGGFPPLVLRLVEGHHERLDASGYPHGRAAGNLELEVRILMVADVYDALTDERVYRPAWPPWQAFELLDSYAGKALDRGCVEALHDVLSPASTPGMTRAEPRGARTHPPRRPRRGPSA
jgi:HD-GYP domain-containing protein (c-di-GMP phosphodiesterase class II)